MVMKNVALLAAITSRTKAYIQCMVKEKQLPNICILYADSKETCYVVPDCRVESSTQKYFDLSEGIMETLNNNSIPFLVVENKDINSDEFKVVLETLDEKYFIYSGYGGSILKPHLFRIGKQFLHVHAGMLPAYRGSTTAYYSMLQERHMGATAIFLNEKIDEGAIIKQKVFPLPHDCKDIDYVYEPWVRAQVLNAALKQYIVQGEFSTIEQGEDYSESYYIIHPVLKHIALLMLEEEREMQCEVKSENSV